MIAQIDLGCSDALFPLLDDIDDHVEMWDALKARLDNDSMHLGSTRVLRKIGASRPSPDETVTQYFHKLIPFHKKLIGTAKHTTDDGMKIHTFTTLSNSNAMVIHILELRIPAATASRTTRVSV
jgi:hypothetical protein